MRLPFGRPRGPATRLPRSPAPSWLAFSTLAFLASRLRQMRDELIAEIHQARSEGDKKIDVLAAALRETEERLQRHELHVAQTFMPRAAVEDGFDRIEKAIASAVDRIDVRFEKVQAKLEARRADSPRSRSVSGPPRWAASPIKGAG